MEVILVLVGIMIVSALVYYISSSYGKAKYGAEEWNRQLNEAMKQSEYGEGYGIKCPNCGQVNVKKISTISRSISVSTLGLASDTIGKTYKCPKCGYIW